MKVAMSEELGQFWRGRGEHCRDAHWERVMRFVPDHIGHSRFKGILILHANIAEMKHYEALGA